MTITCPNNKRHRRFTTTVHELHEWKIDENGFLIEDLGFLETVHGPKKGNTFSCVTCGCEAIVTD